MASILDRLDAWGADLEGERRLFPWCTAMGAAFFVLVRVTMAFATGAEEAFWPTLAELVAGAVAFGAFWGGAAILATRGFTRTFLLGVFGQLLGFVLAAVNVANAARAGYETSLALLTLVELTLLGILAGAALDLLLRARRKARAAPARRAGS